MCFTLALHATYRSPKPHSAMFEGAVQALHDKQKWTEILLRDYLRVFRPRLSLAWGETPGLPKTVWQLNNSPPTYISNLSRG